MSKGRAGRALKLACLPINIAPFIKNPNAYRITPLFFIPGEIHPYYRHYIEYFLPGNQGDGIYFHVSENYQVLEEIITTRVSAFTFKYRETIKI
jgi:hypothetical protein